MKLTHEAYGTTITIEVDRDDLTIEEMMEHFMGLLMCAGYQLDNIKEHFDD